MGRAKRKRTGKWYSKNEKETLLKIGLTPTKQSGAGFIEKEDGYNEKVLAQLKTTDADSYRLTLDDLEKLKYNSMVAHKLPLFIIQFMKTGELYLVIKYEDIKDVTLSMLGVEDLSDLKYEPRGEIVAELSSCENDESSYKNDEEETCEAPIIKTSAEAREKFYEERKEEWEKRKR